MQSNLKRAMMALLLLGALGSVVFTQAFFEATVTTDRNKYGAGETMIISGTGFTANQTVSVSILRPDHITDYILPTPVADGSGSFSVTYAPTVIVSGRYKITATDGTSSTTTAATEADVTGADLDQCRNGSAASPNDCVDLGGGGSGWANGNVGSQQGHLVEGYSIPYRMLFTDVFAGTWTVDLGYDNVHSGGHAIDFLTSYQRLDDPSHVTVFGHGPECVDPPDGFGPFGGPTGTCDPAAPTSTSPIPKPNLPVSMAGNPPGTPPCTVGASGAVIAGATSCPGTTFDTINGMGKEIFSMWGGTINSVTYVTQAVGKSDLETRIRVVFTTTGGANDDKVVLGWGGHIAREQDWGTDNSAGGISGSPYHMRLKGLCSGTAPFPAGGNKTSDLCDTSGNQDRSLSAAVIFIPPSLTLKKHVINDNGGTADASAWTLTATGAGGFSGTGIPATGPDATLGPNVVNMGVQYTLSESGPSGYSSTNIWSCTGGGTFVSPNKITLDNAEKVTCTITNDDVAPQLTLAKHVVNDNGGTANASAWTLTATGSGGFSGTGTPATGVDASLGPNNVTAGVEYSLSESGPGGYSSTDIWSCTGDGTFVSPNKITLAVGGSATCTITNDDVAPQLTLAKHVVNDNGGTADASAWTLVATGSGGFSGTGTPLTGTDASLGPNNVTAGVQYALTETGGPASGYSSTGTWVCTGDGTFVTPNKITLAIGGSATCTITNDDVAPGLTLAKHVINDNGGTANASAWTLTATGSGGFSGTGTPATGADASLGPNNVTAGVEYSLSESGPGGYSSTDIWSCTGDGTFVSPNKITLGVGGSATCTITNDDVAPQLTLAKHVINNNGGTANASEWTLVATGSGGFSGTGTPLTGTDASLGPNNVTAGVQYALTETGGPASGYSSTGTWVCTGDGTFVTPNKITLAVGKSATCTITNDDVAPQLTLAKHVINDNGGAANASAWTLVATGSGGFSGTGTPATGVDASLGPNNVTAGVEYSLSESGGPTGYSSTSIWSCTGDGTFVSPNKITLAVGGSATCTITNDDQPSFLVINKLARNGSATFGFSVVGPSPSAPSVNADTPMGSNFTGTTGAFPINAGDYLVSEPVLPSGQWTLLASECTVEVGGNPQQIGSLTGQPFGEWGFTVGLNTTVTCTFDNDFIAGSTTRTQGFWATHTALSNTLWGTAPANLATICNVKITADPQPGKNQLMGGFWSNIAKISTAKGKNGSRSDEDQARMQMLQQYLAAVLNFLQFSSLPDPADTTLDGALAVYCDASSSASNIRTQAGFLGKFNESGDSGLFTPGINATAKTSKDQADVPFWDNPTTHGLP